MGVARWKIAGVHLEYPFVRRIVWPVILFQFVWLNIVLPVHTRGIVTVGESCDAGSCCAHKVDKSHKTPTREDQKHCAICAFAAALSIPPAFDSTLDLLGPGRLADIRQPDLVQVVRIALTVHERAPPSNLA